MLRSRTAPEHIPNLMLGPRVREGDVEASSTKCQTQILSRHYVHVTRTGSTVRRSIHTKQSTRNTTNQLNRGGHAHTVGHDGIPSDQQARFAHSVGQRCKRTAVDSLSKHLHILMYIQDGGLRLIPHISMRLVAVEDASGSGRGEFRRVQVCMTSKRRKNALMSL